MPEYSGFDALATAVSAARSTTSTITLTPSSFAYVVTVSALDTAPASTAADHVSLPWGSQPGGQGAVRGRNEDDPSAERAAAVLDTVDGRVGALSHPARGIP